MLLRRLWDQWDLGLWLDARTAERPGRYRPSLMVEVPTTLLCYGGGWLDDLKLMAARGVRRAFGWRAAGVEHITVRLDKGFFSKDVVRCLQRLEVSYLLKVPNQPVVRRQLRPWRRSNRAGGIFEEASTVWTSSGRLWGGRLLSLEGRRPLAEAEDSPLGLDTHEVTEPANSDRPASGRTRGALPFTGAARAAAPVCPSPTRAPQGCEDSDSVDCIRRSRATERCGSGRDATLHPHPGGTP